jgi:hypothetical protein
MEDLLLPAAIILTSNVVMTAGAAVLIARFAVGWRKVQEQRLKDEQARLELGTARVRAELDRIKRHHWIAAHEHIMDGEALQLACQELATVLDDETETPIFNGDWRAIRDSLRQQAGQHNKQFNDEQLRKAFRVEVHQEE